MKEAATVKSKRTIKEIEHFLQRHYGNREADVWALGVNLALRITDLLSLKYSDVMDGETVRDHFTVIEGKTKKPRKLDTNATAKRIIEERRNQNPDDVYLFQSKARQLKNKPARPITRDVMAKALKDAGENKKINIPHLASHSMRKSRGYHLFQAGVPIEHICKMFNHASTATTLHYIGITGETVSEMYLNLEL